jgi:hypothetical protein
MMYAVDGAMELLPRAFFPDLPAGYWAGHPGALNEQGQVAVPVGGLLVERDGRTLLIDAGLGPQTGDTPLGPVSSGALPGTLVALGDDPASIGTRNERHLNVPGLAGGKTAGDPTIALSCLTLPANIADARFACGLARGKK